MSCKNSITSLPTLRTIGIVWTVNFVNQALTSGYSKGNFLPVKAEEQVGKEGLEDDSLHLAKVNSVSQLERAKCKI